MNQSFIGCLARKARYSGAVISLRQLSCSLVSPCGQVGEHHGGAGGERILYTTTRPRPEKTIKPSLSSYRCASRTQENSKRAWRQ